jgi:hypothetical protein
MRFQLQIVNRKSSINFHFKRDQGGSTVNLIPIGYHMWMPAQHGMDDAALNPNAPSVNDADFMISLQSRLVEIFFHQDCHIPRLERMQVDRILNKQLHGFHSDPSVIYDRAKNQQLAFNKH